MHASLASTAPRASSHTTASDLNYSTSAILHAGHCRPRTPPAKHPAQNMRHPCSTDYTFSRQPPTRLQTQLTNLLDSVLAHDDFSGFDLAPFLQRPDMSYQHRRRDFSHQAQACRYSLAALTTTSHPGFAETEKIQEQIYPTFILVPDFALNCKRNPLSRARLRAATLPCTARP